MSNSVQLSDFNLMMWNLFVGKCSEQHFKDAIDILKLPHLNIYENDYQLFRELSGRFIHLQTLQIYNTLIQYHNYCMNAKDYENIAKFED